MKYGIISIRNQKIMEGKIRMSKYFETVDFWVENLLDSTENYTVESNEKGELSLLLEFLCLQLEKKTEKV